MRTIKRILELRYQQGLTIREIASSCGLPPSTVGDYLLQAEGAGVGWPLPEALSEQQLHELLRGQRDGAQSPKREKPLPDWEGVHQQLGRKGVTLRLLWEEYRRELPQGYGYSRFCELYKAWRGNVDVVLRQAHEPGRALYVDWAGSKIRIQDPHSGEEMEASVFVAVLGYSNYTYVEAFLSQKLGAWIEGHIHAYEYMQGVTALTVPDNPKTGVIKACRYEPQLHPTYEEMAEHYGTAIVPARVRKPRDKAKVETGVLIAQRRILAPLRDHTFFSLGALNEVLREKLDELNHAPFQKLEGSRYQWWLSEREQLGQLPSHRYDLARWKKATVNIDYHISVDNHFYSVPYQHVGKIVEVRLSESTLEVFLEGERIAAHRRSYRRGSYSTENKHRPKSHQKHLEWTPSRIIAWADSIGPATGKLVEAILKSKPHPEQGYRSCLGVIRLAKGVGAERMEQAARRALHYQLYSYQQVKSILENHLDETTEQEGSQIQAPWHPNIRGGSYYQ